jgi:hypothetical protein
VDEQEQENYSRLSALKGSAYADQCLQLARDLQPVTAWRSGHWLFWALYRESCGYFDDSVAAMQGNLTRIRAGEPIVPWSPEQTC